MGQTSRTTTGEVHGEQWDRRASILYLILVPLSLALSYGTIPVVVLEGLYEGTTNACAFTDNALFRGKGILQDNGFNVMRYSDDGKILASS